MKKIIALIILLMITISGLSYIDYLDYKRPPKIVYQEKIIYQDKIIYKNTDTAEAILKATKLMLIEVPGGDYITDSEKYISEKELLKLMHQYNYDIEIVGGHDIMDGKPNHIRPTE